MNLTIEFYECEHMDDLNSCENDLVSSGAIIIDASLDAEDESAQVVVNVNDRSDFIQRFSQTESYGFSNLCDSIACS